MSKVSSKRNSGNVFADLRVPDAETHLLKAQLVARLQNVIRTKKMTQSETAELMGVSQPDVSRILRGQFRDVSAERLVLFLTRLGCSVDIVVKPANKRAFAPIRLEAEGV
ncbi:MAG: XRE family transcriptional regulator [Proteobacteria bacterium HN_bin10]|nr:MAG: XRE family transcriptional regulator [Proteobacteria bacterium HN_bin10]